MLWLDLDSDLFNCSWTSSFPSNSVSLLSLELEVLSHLKLELDLFSSLVEFELVYGTFTSKLFAYTRWFDLLSFISWWRAFVYLSVLLNLLYRYKLISLFQQADHLTRGNPLQLLFAVFIWLSHSLFRFNLLADLVINLFHLSWIPIQYSKNTFSGYLGSVFIIWSSPILQVFWKSFSFFWCFE